MFMALCFIPQQIQTAKLWTLKVAAIYWQSSSANSKNSMMCTVRKVQSVHSLLCQTWNIWILIKFQALSFLKLVSSMVPH